MKVPSILALSVLAAALGTTAAVPAWAQAAPAAAAAAACPALLQHSFPRLQDEKPQNLCQYAGKVLLVVNTASKCGFTPQYEGLEALNARYGPQGLVVLGFPSGDFGGQELKDSKEIADFCFNTYGVKFPMFAKSSVKGSAANPLYVQLIQATGKTPGWNFHKYLIGRDGKPLGSYGSNVTPTAPTLVAEIEKALAAK
ncbi:glutathione peroxidase [Rubrivivax rivuli]|uniref:Glutathione peroxidase n=1 Tax=Rubrivivax rivuli TaxID=1862385 RepID=A0A437RL82_9BURK|nr:glutathione peroxidase [Rubrivivax rivuli]RVU47355.1 glutathione peroxidase [Rubrivivax rivuli]